MQRVPSNQLSFDAQPETRTSPPDAMTATVGVTGKFEFGDILNPDCEIPLLSHGETVIVTIGDADGNVIAQGGGTVAIGFKDKTVEGLLVTIREQRIKLG